MSENVVELSQEQLEDRLKFWQDKLNLKDWKISVDIKRGKEIGENCCGRVLVTPAHRVAEISILDPIDRDPTKFYCAPSMESTLVHELVEVVFWFIEEKHYGIEHDVKEQAINSITDTLMKMQESIHDRIPGSNG